MHHLHHLMHQFLIFYDNFPPEIQSWKLIKIFQARKTILLHISEGSTVVIPVMKNLEMDHKLIGRTNVMDQNFTEMQEMSPT